MSGDAFSFVGSLLFLFASVIALVYVLFPGAHLTAEQSLERRIEYSVLTCGSVLGFVVLWWMG
jgi:hypothetical protein